ncbi:MAG: glucose-1-phosphate thymidylyltransferase [Bacteroides sp.]|nr:glucose-1-phosphate thymidylyltransferase [Bacteroides sp.]MCM1379419.1 glucose-1-phosphate thymidylyltransferase [Bacteroides sp.]MCM1445279.1 glucose-1-phosphate thymidylyltransferase [Prevotella sp.]
MHIILEDIEEVRTALMPLTLTRPVGALPAGICDTIAERWQRLIPGATIDYKTEDYLSAKYPCGGDGITIPGHILPTSELARKLLNGEDISRARGYRHLTDIFRLSKELITADFALLTAGRKSAPLPQSCTLIGDASQLFIEEGAEVEGAFINVKAGPVYIGAGAEVQECVALRGPVAIGPKCRVRAGARLLPGTNLGPVTRVGGEISNTVFLGYANKQHDGFLGDAVIGQWTNLGAGCVASNLKNDYAEIRLWSYATRRFERTGLQFCGLIMGDHTKAAINTTFNTATVVGVGCNIHGYGYPRPFVESFTDGGLQTVSRVPLKKFLQTATIAMSHRDVKISDEDIAILTHLYNSSSSRN